MNNFVCAALIAVCATCPAIPADLKTGEAVLDNFVESSGGAVAYAKIHNMVMKGSMSMAAMGILLNIAGHQRPGGRRPARSPSA